MADITIDVMVGYVTYDLRASSNIDIEQWEKMTDDEKEKYVNDLIIKAVRDSGNWTASLLDEKGNIIKTIDI